MIPLPLLTTLAVTVSIVQAHQSFVRLALNNVWQEPFRFIRNRTAPFEELSTPDTNYNVRNWTWPTYASDIPNSVRCARDNMAHAHDTDILRVKAGDSIEFVAVGLEPLEYNISLGLVRWDGCAEGRGACGDLEGGSFPRFIHTGPVVMHLSQVPPGQDVRTYDGSGEWVKIHTSGLVVRKDPDRYVWLANNGDGEPARFITKIPKQTPAGQYLLRVDQIWPGYYWKEGNTIVRGSEGQLYPSCAQIEVESEVVGGKLPKGIKIPEDFSPASPGMQTNRDEQLGNFTGSDYVYPGGPLWDGETFIHEKLPSLTN